VFTDPQSHCRFRFWHITLPLFTIPETMHAPAPVNDLRNPATLAIAGDAVRQYLGSMQPQMMTSELGPLGLPNHEQPKHWHEHTRRSFFDLLGILIYNQLPLNNATRELQAYVWLTNEPDVFSQTVRPDTCRTG
jgi:hypothetical protein